MRDAQVRRYARHILLPDLGGHGQARLLAATATLELTGDDRPAALICARYLAAGGVGQVVVRGASEAERASVAAHADDGEAVVTAGDGPALALPAPPAWWPSAAADAAVALAFWRGGLAATRWMAATGNP